MSGKSKGMIGHGLPRSETWKSDAKEKRKAAKKAKASRKKNRATK